MRERVYAAGHIRTRTRTRAQRAEHITVKSILS